MLANNANKFAKKKCSAKGKEGMAVLALRNYNDIVCFVHFLEFLSNMSCLTPTVKPKIDAHINKFSSIVGYIAANVTKDAKVRNISMEVKSFVFPANPNEVSCY